MNWISNLFSGYWRGIHLGTVVALVLILVTGGEKVQSLVSGITVSTFHYPFFLVRTTTIDLSRVNEENARMHLALRDASLRISLLEETQRENDRLRGLLDFKPPPDYLLQQARVISVAGQHLPVTATINRGSQDSVAVDQAIINDQGLIGRVISVFRTTAIVQLLTDPAHRVAVRVAESREMGIVKYRSSEGMLLDNLPIQGTVVPGDRIVSSGLGQIYPAGLVVGTVTSVERPEEEPFCTIHLQPAANFNTLEDLFVLRAVTP